MLTIGQMSKACGVSVKTLRHYDKIGLLKADETDPYTGYRYYADGQIGIMLLISRLKRYGFSLSDIQSLLQIKEPKQLQRQLKFQRLRLDREMEHLSVTIREIERHLENFERTGDIMSYQNQYEVVLKESQLLVLATSRQEMSVEDFGNYYGKIFERLAKEHLTPTGLTAAIYHDEEFDPACSDIEVGVEIMEQDKADQILNPTLCATTIHVGPYASLPDAYGKITAWIKAEGYRVTSAPYEVYRKTSFDKLAPEDWETEIYFPVAK